MLRPIYKVPCWHGLAAIFDLQIRFARWLCEVTTDAAQVNEANIRCLHPNVAVQGWLWDLLCLSKKEKTFLTCARNVAAQSVHEKQRLNAWLEVVAQVSTQFQPAHLPWPKPPKDLSHWGDFKELMEVFYARFGSAGIPFDADGKPVAVSGVTYSAFLKEFEQLHGDQACVVCGGYLSKPQVDHWIAKAAFPILSVAPDNVLPICYECNTRPCKGEKDVFVASATHAFGEWFHPFHRPGYGRFNPTFDNKTLKIRPEPTNQGETPHVANLDGLFQLSERWTRSYKATEKEWRTYLRQMIANGYFPATEQAIAAEAQRRIDGLVAHSPNYSVDRLFYTCTQDPTRLRDLVADLAT